MQLSASTLPYDPPAASAADPALAADRASRNSSPNAPADGFGAMLVAKSNAPAAPAKSGASAKPSSSPLGATVANADETDATDQETDSTADDAAAATPATDPAAGEGVPDAAAMANWLAANGVLAPLASATETSPVGLELTPGNPEATGGVEESASSAADSICAAGLTTPNQTPGQPAAGISPGESAGLPAGAPTADSAATTADSASAPAAVVRFGRLLTQATPADAKAELPAAAIASTASDETPLSPAGEEAAAVAAQASTPVPAATTRTKIQSTPSGSTSTADATAPDAAIAPGELADNAAEKFAALQERFLRRYSIGDKAELKKAIAPASEVVAGPSSVLGINAAQPVSAMPALTLTPSPAAAEHVSAVSAPLTFDALVKEVATLPNEVSHAASRAVDSVMAIADHFGTGGQRAVSLQFTVSGVELAVHVELRGNAVHTTFRTDSPELRAALAAEWQSVNPTASGNRSQWLADPVFSSSSSGNGMSGNTNSGFQQHADARQGQPQAFAEDMARLRSPLRVPAPATPAVASTPSARPVVVTSSRLHAFA